MEFYIFIILLIPMATVPSLSQYNSQYQNPLQSMTLKY